MDNPTKNTSKPVLAHPTAEKRGDIATLTKAKKSTPGDGSFGKGVKGDRGGEA